MTINETDRKLGELILYISQKSVKDTYFGATKLNKILYFSDFLAFGNWGKSITGAEYQHLDRGPAPRRLLPVRRALEEEGAFATQPAQFHGKLQHRPINLREPDLSIFTGREIALVDQVIESLRGLSATEASDLSHLELGWRLTKNGETIDYKTILLSDEPLPSGELRRLQELMAIEADLAAA